MHLSAHVDTFARDHLPPPEDWPELRFDLPELRYPARLNCAVELLDQGRAMMLSQLSRYRTALDDLADSAEPAAKALAEQFVSLGKAMGAASVSASHERLDQNMMQTSSTALYALILADFGCSVALWQSTA